MYLLSTYITLALVCINGLLSAELVSKKRPIFECALHRCPTVKSECEWSRSSSRCCSICPEERRCHYNGKWYNSGQSFKDSCNSCFCSNGLVRCTMQECITIDKPCFYKGKVYAHGSSFKDDCNTCGCNQGRVGCTKIGCGTNKSCFYKGKVYAHGSSFKDDCNTCRCTQGSVGCTKIGCAKTCFYKGKKYNEGQMIPSKNPCRTCYCRNGLRTCSFVRCLHVHCIGQRRVPGVCCPVCDDILAAI